MRAPHVALLPQRLAAARNAAAGLRDWLLHGPAQLQAGEHSGGVAGTIAVDGTALYVYAEITGYYLSWLADIDDGGEVVRARARAALAWATRHFPASGRAPATRIHLTASEPDWRNDAVFFFDLAMLLRGVDAASEAGLVVGAQPLRRVLHEQLSQFSNRDTLSPVIQWRGAQPLPPRWSTLGGPFLLKASARVAYGARHTALPDALERACANESARWAMQAADIDLGMLHPTLYFAEGLLLSRPDRADAIAQLLRRCLACARSDGTLPETATDPQGKTRYDILAQALRVGVLLRATDARQAPTQHELDHLAATLLARIDACGFLPFNADSGGQANIWCTMFAEQALRWYSSDAHADRLSAAALV